MVLVWVIIITLVLSWSTKINKLANKLKQTKNIIKTIYVYLNKQQQKPIKMQKLKNINTLLNIN